MTQVLDHLWQSTLLALGLALLALAFSKASASVRYGLWFAASVKFLIPLAALAMLGRLIGPAIPLPAAAKPEAAFVAQAAAPFSQPVPPLTQFPFAQGPELQAPLAQAPAAVPLAHTDAAAAAIHAAPRLNLGLILLAVWGLGSAAMLVLWAGRWTRLRRVVRSARRLDWIAPMPVLAAPSLLEPGLVGLWRPVLLVPETLPERLSQAEIDALLAHEACHLRRRDNLAAALHMLVEALFWLHPLVWWIGARMIEERERACDEAVVRAGHDRAAYARSLVEICRYYLQSPLDCVAGASGSDLKTRVEAIMTAPPTSPLSRSKKALLLAVGACAFATPVAAGLLTTSQVQTAVTNAAALASRIEPVHGQAAHAQFLADEAQPAKPIVLARNEAVLSPALSVTEVDPAPAPLSQAVAVPGVEVPPPAAAPQPVQPGTASPPEPQPSAAVEPPITPADAKRLADQFVKSYGDFTTGVFVREHQTARWDWPICLQVAGLAAAQETALRARIAEVAKSVEVTVDPASCKTPNLQIAFATDPQGVLDGLVEQDARVLGDRTSDTRNIKTVTRPIQAWYVTNGVGFAENDRNDANSLKVPVVYQMATPCHCDTSGALSVLGSGPQANGAYVPYGSSASGNSGSGFGSAFPGAPGAGWQGVPRATDRRFVNVLVIVDLRRAETRTRSLGRLADYVAMVALTQPHDLGQCQALPSITDLFASCTGRSPPEGLTAADAAYLTALYPPTKERPFSTGTEAAVAQRMASILAADSKARADAAPAQPIKPASAVAPAAPPRLMLTHVAATSPSTDARSEVSDFVKSYGEAFWNQDKWICVRVEGLPSNQAAAVKARVESDARAVGVSVGRAECGLRNEVEIRFAGDADRAVQDVLNYYHNPIWPFPLDRPQGADRPIRAWYGMVYDFAGGAGRERNLGSDPSARQKLALSIVVVDPARTQNLSLDTVSDYVTMLALSQPRSLDRCNMLPSITDLFAGACPGRSAPTGLTAADDAFLRALYAGSPGIRATRSPSELVEGVAKRLAADRTTAL